jgi:hypothetical protein
MKYGLQWMVLSQPFSCLSHYSKMKSTSEQARIVGTRQMHEAQAGMLDPIVTQSAHHVGRKA